MRNRLKLLLRDESGAVSVDWVVLTAAIVALAVAVFAILNSGSGGIAGGVRDYLSTLTVGGK